MKIQALVSAILLTSLCSFAQSKSLEEATARLFGKTTAFSADLSISSAKGEVAMNGKFYFDHGKTRFEGSLPKSIAPTALEQMQKLGLDKIFSINRPDLRKNYMVYPTLKAYTLIDYAVKGTTNEDVTITSAVMGKETVIGHVCDKTLVKFANAGSQHELTTWNAVDLDGFPIKVEMGLNADVMSIIYTNLNTKVPDPSLFEPPTEFTKYESQEELMKAVFAQKH